MCKVLRDSCESECKLMSIKSVLEVSTSDTTVQKSKVRIPLSYGFRPPVKVVNRSTWLNKAALLPLLKALNGLFNL